MTLFRARPVRIQPYFGYRSRHRLVLQARALRGSALGFTGKSGWRAMRVLARQFLSAEVPDVEVTLEVESRHGAILQRTGTTDSEGHVRFDIALAPEWDLPAHPEWETAIIRWSGPDGPQEVPAQVLAPGADGKLAVISDIDDTIIETGITGGPRSLLRNWRRIFAQLPGERIAAPGAATFYSDLGGGHVLPSEDLRTGTCLPATRRPFFYISSSPWNLFSYLVAFMRAKKLPLGPVLLRDWGFNRRTFGKKSHGAHKTAAIDHILNTFPDLRFALIGDDTQGDLPAFAQAVECHPGRIVAIFLRTVAGEEFTPHECTARDAIARAEVPLWLGESYAVGAEFLRCIGVTLGGETDQILRVVERADDEAATEVVPE